MGFSKQCVDQAADWMIRLYDLFIDKDAVMVEINPMSEDLLGRGIITAFVVILSVFFIVKQMQNSTRFLVSLLMLLVKKKFAYKLSQDF